MKSQLNPYKNTSMRDFKFEYPMYKIIHTIIIIDI